MSEYLPSRGNQTCNLMVTSPVTYTLTFLSHAVTPDKLSHWRVSHLYNA
uniref:Uncharacterized protein n=1 Tax=Anguilla anguilla TaxID=7936 RepID=A0A0E9STE2_ANGAN